MVKSRGGLWQSLSVPMQVSIQCFVWSQLCRRQAEFCNVCSLEAVEAFNTACDGDFLQKTIVEKTCRDQQ